MTGFVDETVTASGLRVVSEAADGGVLLRAIESHRLTLARGRGVLKAEHKTDITRSIAAGRPVVVKHYRYMGLRFLLKGLFTTHPGRRSLRAAKALVERGIATPRVLGLVERRVLGLVAESWFVTGDIEGAVSMDRYMARHFPGRRDVDRRRRFVLSFARSFRRLMSSGIRHHDLKTCNILVADRDEGWEFFYIDLDDVESTPRNDSPTEAEWVAALSQLNSSTPKSVSWTDRLRFLARLPALLRFDRKRLIARIQEASRERGRRYFSDDGPVELDFV